MQDYPAFLRDQNDSLERIAYQLRSSSEGKIKTKIVLQGTTLALHTKEGKEGNWQSYQHQ